MSRLKDDQGVLSLLEASRVFFDSCLPDRPPLTSPTQTARQLSSRRTDSTDTSCSKEQATRFVAFLTYSLPVSGVVVKRSAPSCSLGYRDTLSCCLKVQPCGQCELYYSLWNRPPMKCSKSNNKISVATMFL